MTEPWRQGEGTQDVPKEITRSGEIYVKQTPLSQEPMASKYICLGPQDIRPLQSGYNDKGNSRHRNHNHSHHVGFIPAFVVSPQPCEPSYPDPISWMEKKALSPEPQSQRELGGSPRSSGLGVWPSTYTREWASQSSHLASHPGWGEGGRIYKRQNQREQLEAEAWKKPHRPPSQRRGLSVVRGSLAHSQV